MIVRYKEKKVTFFPAQVDKKRAMKCSKQNSMKSSMCTSNLQLSCAMLFWVSFLNFVRKKGRVSREI